MEWVEIWPLFVFDEERRHSEADQRRGFRIHHPQRRCHGFPDHSQHAHFSRWLISLSLLNLGVSDNNLSQFFIIIYLFIFIIGSFAEAQHGQVTFPEIGTTVLEKICKYFYWNLQFARFLFSFFDALRSFDFLQITCWKMLKCYIRYSKITFNQEDMSTMNNLTHQIELRLNSQFVSAFFFYLL